MSTESAYPSLAERVVRVEEQMVAVKDDVREVKQTLSNILRALWALVLVLIPVAAGIISLAVQMGG